MSPKDTLAMIMRGLEADGLDVVAEYVFHPTRKFRLDWAIPSLRIGLEYNGHHTSGAGGRGAKSGKAALLRFAAPQEGKEAPPATSGHSSLTGISRDAEKGNTASLLGWHILRFTALHFDPASRAKHKLSPPRETILELVRVQRLTIESDLVPRLQEQLTNALAEISRLTLQHSQRIS